MGRLAWIPYLVFLIALRLKLLVKSIGMIAQNCHELHILASLANPENSIQAMEAVLAREHRTVQPTNVERTFGQEEVIVSKTDTVGVITYANPVFCRVAGFSASELLGTPHNIIRHPDMPRCVFKYLWDRIAEGHELFGYVKNMARNGDYYWVFAHVTPTYNKIGEIIGYHSNRRCPDRQAIATIEPVYKLLLDIEQKHDRREGLELSYNTMVEFFRAKGVSYDEFIFSITR